MPQDYYVLPPRIGIVHCTTTAGPISFKIVEKWSPNGFDRALELFRRGFYDGSHFFRVVPGFLVQFGMSYSKDVELIQFAEFTIQDDPQLNPPIKFEEGVISFAGSGPQSRTSHLFISYGSSPGLGTQLWETPIGKVIEGMENVKKLYSGYGDMPPWGNGPEQWKISKRGEAYINEEFPKLDKFNSCLSTDVELAVGEDLSAEDELYLLQLLKQEIGNVQHDSRSSVQAQIIKRSNIYMQRKMEQHEQINEHKDDNKSTESNIISKNRADRIGSSQDQVLSLAQRVEFPILASILLFGVIRYLIKKHDHRTVRGKKSND